MMIKVGLTGNRFSGKSKICNMFNDIGIPIFDADLVIKFILTYNEEIINTIINSLGDKYTTNGEINLYKIDEDSKMNRVFEIIEEDIFEAYRKFEDKNKESIYTIFSSSVLFENKWNNRMHENISIFCPFINRVERGKLIMSTNATYINELLKTESCGYEKNGKSDYTIHNYAKLELKGQIMKVDNKIIDNYFSKYGYSKVD